MVKVSVIVPIYNVENYLSKCLNSLVAQTMQEGIQILLVNDGSTDKSKEIALAYAEKYSDKIQYLEKENGGLSDARNFAFPFIKGEYVAFLDSDDYVEENMYQELYDMAKKEDSDMVECDFYWEYPKKQKLDTKPKYQGKKEMLVQARVVAWNKLIRAELLQRTDILFPKGYRYEDVEFFYKLVPYLEKVSFVKKPFIHYIQRDNSISNSQNERTKEIFDVLEHVIQFYKEKGFYEEYKTELEYIYTRFLLCSSLVRMVKIKDTMIRKQCIQATWEKLNIQFPTWKKNAILKKGKTMKDRYMKTVNRFTYPIYTAIASLK